MIHSILVVAMLVVLIVVVVSVIGIVRGTCIGFGVGVGAGMHHRAIAEHHAHVDVAMCTRTPIIAHSCKKYHQRWR